jgi:thioredoxin 1
VLISRPPPDCKEIRSADPGEYLKAALVLTWITPKRPPGGNVSEIPDVTEQDFNETVLAADMPIVVDFWAEWCGPCRLVHPELEKLQAEYEGKLKVVKLNIDDAPTVSAKYGVMSIPTIALFKDGSMQSHVIGARPKDAIVEGLQLDNLLPASA